MLKKIRPQVNFFGNVSCFIFGMLVAGVIMILLGMVDSKAAVGFLGVIIGSVVTSGTTLLTARETRKQQFALAALDKRLNVHQAAYTLWQRIIADVHHKCRIGEVVNEANDWWNNNCLYLDAVSREDFRACLLSASNHSALLEEPRDKEIEKMIKENWAIIMKPGQTLPAGVSLPGLGEQEPSLDHS